ncbi:Fic family protein [Mesorhizobium sp. VNQ89]|uniref:Fic family protein n=1 Tax=Mesorhizobium quangtriensis TaxID=3157709 RepID=UPI0032B72F99
MTLADVVLAKKWELDALRHTLPADALADLEHNHRIGITYASNAIDGSTLTPGETALILERGMTFAGRPLKDHLQVAEHAGALDWIIRASARPDAPIGESDIRHLHRLAVCQSIPEISGRYADKPRRMETEAGAIDFLGSAGIPALMADFCAWLAPAPKEPATAFEAHFRLMAIHPFNDGNGRAARLLTNWLLARCDFPLIAIRPEDFSAYSQAIGKGLRDNDNKALSEFFFQRLDSTLDTFLGAARRAQAQAVPAASTRT